MEDRRGTRGAPRPVSFGPIRPSAAQALARDRQGRGRRTWMIVRRHWASPVGARGPRGQCTALARKDQDEIEAGDVSVIGGEGGKPDHTPREGPPPASRTRPPPPPAAGEGALGVGGGGSPSV